MAANVGRAPPAVNRGMPAASTHIFVFFLALYVVGIRDAGIRAYSLDAPPR